MQDYDVKCPSHGIGQTWGSMQDAMNGALKCWVDGCTDKIERHYPRGRHGFDHTENTFKPWHSDQLSLNGEPVYVKNRVEEAGLMQNMGLQRWEPGMKSKAAEQASANRRRKERARSESR